MLKQKTAIVVLLGFLLSARSVHSEEFVYDSHARRDPFVPFDQWAGTSGSVGMGGLHLEGIILDAGGSYAIVNGQIIQAGDELGIFSVTAIEANRVLLHRDGEGFSLVLRRDQELIERIAGGEFMVRRKGVDEESEGVLKAKKTEQLPEETVDEELKKLAEMTKKRLLEDSQQGREGEQEEEQQQVLIVEEEV